MRGKTENIRSFTYFVLRILPRDKKDIQIEKNFEIVVIHILRSIYALRDEQKALCKGSRPNRKKKCEIFNT